MKLFLTFLLFFPIATTESDPGQIISAEQSLLFRVFTEPFSEPLLKEAVYHFITERETAFAQAKLETGNFQSKVFKEQNNLFGMRMPKVRQTFALYQCGYYAYYSHWIYSVWDYELMYRWYIDRGKSFEYMLEVYCPDSDYLQKIKFL
jgi:hypothetical protein